MADVNVGDRINAVDYNSRRDIIDSLYVTSWAQTSRSADVAATVDHVEAEQLEELYLDLQSCWVHQTGAVEANLAVPAVAQTIGADTSQDYDQTTGAFSAVANGTLMGFNDYEALNVAVSNYPASHLSYDASSFSLESTATAQRTTNWGVNSANDDIYHVIDVDWATSAAKIAWENAGGRLHFTASLTGGSGAKSTDWANLLSAMGTVYIDKYDTSATSGTTYNLGFDNLTGTYQLMFDKSGSGAYSDNNYRIYGKVQSGSTTGIRFRIRFYDGDTGTGDLGGAGTGTPIDEEVDGTLNSACSSYSPDSSFTYNSVSQVAVDLTGVTKGGIVTNASSTTQNNLGDYSGSGLL
jgi:hypothetical protein